MLAVAEATFFMYTAAGPLWLGSRGGEFGFDGSSRNEKVRVDEALVGQTREPPVSPWIPAYFRVSRVLNIRLKVGGGEG